jgi:hypothetical protein
MEPRIGLARSIHLQLSILPRELFLRLIHIVQIEIVNHRAQARETNQQTHARETHAAQVVLALLLRSL